MLCNGRINADALLRLAHSLEFHYAVDHGEEGIVTSDADIVSRMHLRSALAHQNAPGGDCLPAETLDAQTLSITIASITRTSTTFFMSHAVISRLDESIQKTMRLW